MATPRASVSNQLFAGTSGAVTTPVGAAVGDTLIVILCGDANDITYTPPSVDWTQLFDLAEAPASQPMGFAAFALTLTGAPAATYTFTASAGPMRAIAVCIDAEGETISGITYTAINSSAVASNTTPSLANTSTSRVLFAIFANDTDFGVSSAPSGMTLQGRGTQDTSVIQVYTEDDPVGTPLTRSITWSSVDDNYSAQVLVTYASGGGGGSTQPPRTYHRNRMQRAA